MGTALATNGVSAGDIMDRVIAVGDLSRLTPADRCLYYNRVCESVGLNPLTRPFEYITLNNKLTLYARKDATDQLREIKGISIYRLEQEEDGELYVVTAYAENAKGRKDTDTGAVVIGHLKGEARANAMMKAVTKAKRRVTLSICGLGMLDETEVETVPSARATYVDAHTGEIIDRRNSDPPRNATKVETIDGRMVHAPVIDPATNRPAAVQYRNEDDDEATAHFAPRATQEEANRAAALRKGIGSHKGWMVNAGLAAEDKQLSLYLLNRAANNGNGGWTSRKELTATDWQETLRVLGTLKPAELKAWVADYHATLEREEAGATEVDPFEDDTPLTCCPACGLPHAEGACTVVDALIDVPATAPEPRNAQLV